MHPIEVMLGVGALASPVTAIMAAIRWKRSFASRPPGWRFWLTPVSLVFSSIVAVAFMVMLFRAGFVDFNARYEEYLVWLQVMLVISLFAVLAAAFGRGAGRILSLLTSGLVFGFILLVASIPP
ncbi:MAG TPA: hypothetical protein VFT65_16300 [Candidatus Angelobacter sp.]|nr:hypothetical protein [Candidatus Angelobacter sp.]